MSTLTRLLALGGAAVAAQRLLRRARPAAATSAPAPLHVEAGATVDRPRAEVFRMWSDPEILARAVGSYATATALDPQRARWTLRAPAGIELSFEAITTEQREPELIRFRSGPGAPLGFTGEVTFDEPAPGRTSLRVRGDADLPGGQIGSTVAGLLGDVPDRAFEAGLKRFADSLEDLPRV